MSRDQDARGELAGQRTLVTGARGFIGARLCGRLLEGGAQVHALSRAQEPEGSYGIHWHCGDLADARSAQELIQTVEPETVFHLASQVSGAAGVEYVRPMIENNLLGTVNLLTALQEHGCRRIVVTGSVVEPRDDEPATSPYAAAKGAATEYTRMFHSLYGTPVVGLRVAMVYGPGQPDSRKVIPHVIESLLRGEKPRVSSGRWEVDWIYVDDVVEALLLAATAEGAVGHTLDVGSDDVASIRSVVKQLADMIDPALHPSFDSLEDRPLERSVSSDLDRTRKVLGWRPTVRLKRGLEETVNWYRERLPVLAWAMEAATAGL
jgi:UDP-glucose 4-epimerase